MLSPTPREGVGARIPSGARALVLCLALAGSLAAAPAASPPTRTAKELTGGASAAPTPSAPADPDATLQRLAEEAAQIDPSSPEALARLRTVVRDLIEFERATRRELAALRREVAELRAAANRSVAAPASRRSRAESASAAGRSPATGGTVGAKIAPAVPVSSQASGALFGKRGLKKVHRPGCTFGERIRPEDRVSFSTMQEATAAGYEACKVCRPE